MLHRAGGSAQGPAGCFFFWPPSAQSGAMSSRLARPRFSGGGTLPSRQSPAVERDAPFAQATEACRSSRGRTKLEPHRVHKPTSHAIGQLHRNRLHRCTGKVEGPPPVPSLDHPKCHCCQLCSLATIRARLAARTGVIQRRWSGQLPHTEPLPPSRSDLLHRALAHECAVKAGCDCSCAAKVLFSRTASRMKATRTPVTAAIRCCKTFFFWSCAHTPSFLQRPRWLVRSHSVASNTAASL